MSSRGTPPVLTGSNVCKGIPKRCLSFEAPGLSLARSGSSAYSLDRLVGAPEERQRDCEAERLGGLEVQDQLDLGRLLHRQVGGLLALENPAGVDASQTECICNTASVAHKTTGRREPAIMI